MKRRWATFHATRFEHKTPAPHFINPTCFGEDVAAWLRPHLETAGLQPGEPIQEDYGWGLWARSGGDPYWIAIGCFADDDSGDEAEWGIGVAYDPGFNLRKRLFHRPRDQDLLRVAVAVDAALKGDPAIRRVEWWLEEPHRAPASPVPV